MSTGVRPKIGNIDLDLGWTYYLYPSGGTPPVGTMPDINYWEFVARADTNFGESLHLAAGSGAELDRTLLPIGRRGCSGGGLLC